MEKKTEVWSMDHLIELHALISFPEYQREPNLWARSAKQRLIDSMVRKFDIASIYLYFDVDGAIDCIDGRQRIGAIMSFLGENPDDEDNSFEFRFTNEIYDDEPSPFDALEGLTYSAIKARAENDEVARSFVSNLRESQITVVQLSGSARAEEFNLQFARLNVGLIINSGEKLHAMVGELREVCFADDGLGQHAFLDAIKIPTRRFAKEQMAAQILAQVFSFAIAGEFTRTRHFDLQRLFKDCSALDTEKRRLVDRTREIFDLLLPVFQNGSVLRNRAITVSTVLLMLKLNIRDPDEVRQLAEFVTEFVRRLKWQVRKNLDVDPEYRYLIDFQRHVTQASVEKPAVVARAAVFEEEFLRWKENHTLNGDAGFRERTGHEPGDDLFQ